MLNVPTISRFFGIVITMYFDDHGPPHFHARHADGEAKVRIDTLEVIDSTSTADTTASSSRGPNSTKTNSPRIGEGPVPVKH